MKPYYSDDYVTIYHGDCREVAPCGGDLVVTDPPYGIAWSKPELVARGSRGHDGIVGDADTTVRDEVLGLCALPAIVFGSFQAPFPPDTKQVLIWHKPSDSGLFGAIAGYRRDIEPVFLVGKWARDGVARSSVLTAPALFRGHAGAQSGSHPHVKPVDLIAKLILPTSAQTVLDPFMGSGTTLVAAKNLGRKAIGIEIEERYCEIAAERCSQGVLDFTAAP